MEQAQARQSELAEKNRKIEEELKELQQQLVATAGDVQSGEVDLSKSEEKLKILSDQMRRKSDALAAREKNLNALILAALRLSHTPPEAVVMMPGDSMQAVKASRALKMASGSIRREINGIRLQMAELAQLKDKIAANRAEFTKKQAGLDKIRQSLRNRLSARQALQEKLWHEQRAQAKKLAGLSKKAEDLQGLVATLKQGEKEQKAPGQKGKLRPFAEAKGHLKTPVAGKLIRPFGIAAGRNETSKGIQIDARARAQVVAPYDGEVVFAGPFRGYGKLVIIRHSDDFHTLLAGLDKITTSPGEFLLEGEPIGAMGEKSPANRLYVELRKDTQPIDPAAWIGGLATSSKEHE